jgi:hypothetical protein
MRKTWVSDACFRFGKIRYWVDAFSDPLRSANRQREFQGPRVSRITTLVHGSSRFCTSEVGTSMLLTLGMQVS